MRLQCGEQRFVGGRVGSSHVVDRIDETATEVVRPRSVGDGPREERVVRLSQPRRENLSAIGHIREVSGLRSECPRGNEFPRARMLGVGTTTRDDRFGSVRQSLESRPRKEAREASVVVLAPAFARVMMALSALDAHAEKQLAHRATGHFRLVERLEECGRTLTLNGSLNRENLTDELVVRTVRLKLFSQPACQPDRPLGRDF